MGLLEFHYLFVKTRFQSAWVDQFFCLVRPHGCFYVQTIFPLRGPLKIMYTFPLCMVSNISLASCGSWKLSFFNQKPPIFLYHCGQCGLGPAIPTPPRGKWLLHSGSCGVVVCLWIVNVPLTSLNSLSIGPLTPLHLVIRFLFS